MFEEKKKLAFESYEKLIAVKNQPDSGLGIVTRWREPVLTRAHVPPF
jgi:hypothetical protein